MCYISVFELRFVWARVWAHIFVVYINTREYICMYMLLDRCLYTALSWTAYIRHCLGQDSWKCFMAMLGVDGKNVHWKTTEEWKAPCQLLYWTPWNLIIAGICATEISFLAGYFTSTYSCLSNSFILFILWWVQAANSLSLLCKHWVFFHFFLFFTVLLKSCSIFKCGFTCLFFSGT